MAGGCVTTVWVAGGWVAGGCVAGGCVTGACVVGEVVGVVLSVGTVEAVEGALVAVGVSSTAVTETGSSGARVMLGVVERVTGDEIFWSAERLSESPTLN